MIASGLVALLFLETAAWAAPAPFSEVISDQRPFVRDGIKVESLVKKIQIPNSLGSIQEVFQSSVSGLPSLVYLEDAHGEPEAQKNIQAILEHLQKEYGVKTFFLEGAWSQLDPKLLNFTENQKANQDILERLAEKGIVGGPENFLWENSQNDAGGQTPMAVRVRERGLSPVTGFGIEDLDLYKKNLEQFRAVMGAKDKSDAFLEKMKAEILKKASQALNPELAEYFRSWSFQEEVQADYGRHIGALANSAHKYLRLDLNDAREQYDWPQLVRFQKLKSYEGEASLVKRRSIQTEEQTLKAWLGAKKIKADWLFDSEIRDARYERRGKREIFETFYAAAAPLGFQFKDYPALSKEWGKQILAQELDAPTLLKETQKLEEQLLEKLAQKQEEKKVIQKYREYLLFKKILHLELSKSEWRGLKGSVLDAKQRGLTPMVSKVVEQANAFYQTAEARDAAMFARTIDWIKKEKIQKAAIITGGFHSEGMAELFKQKNISYLRVQPRITQITGRENYLKLMMSANTPGVTGTTPSVDLVSHLRLGTLVEPRLAQELPEIEAAYRAEIAERTGGRALVSAQPLAGLNESARLGGSNSAHLNETAPFSGRSEFRVSLKDVKRFFEFRWPAIRSSLRLWANKQFWRWQWRFIQSGIPIDLIRIMRKLFSFQSKAASFADYWLTPVNSIFEDMPEGALQEPHMENDLKKLGLVIENNLGGKAISDGEFFSFVHSFASRIPSADQYLNYMLGFRMLIRGFSLEKRLHVWSFLTGSYRSHLLKFGAHPEIVYLNPERYSFLKAQGVDFGAQNNEYGVILLDEQLQILFARELARELFENADGIKRLDVRAGDVNVSMRDWALLHIYWGLDILFLLPLTATGIHSHGQNEEGLEVNRAFFNLTGVNDFAQKNRGLLEKIWAAKTADQKLSKQWAEHHAAFSEKLIAQVFAPIQHGRGIVTMSDWKQTLLDATKAAAQLERSLGFQASARMVGPEEDYSTHNYPTRVIGMTLGAANVTQFISHLKTVFGEQELPFGFDWVQQKLAEQNQAAAGLKSRSEMRQRQDLNKPVAGAQDFLQDWWQRLWKYLSSEKVGNVKALLTELSAVGQTLGGKSAETPEVARIRKRIQPATEMVAAQFRPSFGSSLVWFPSAEQENKELLAQLAGIQSRLKEIFDNEYLEIKKQDWHLTVRNLSRDLNQSVPEADLIKSAGDLRSFLATLPAAEGMLVGPFWHREFGFTMIWKPQPKDPILTAKYRTETAMPKLEAQDRLIHLTLGYHTEAALTGEKLRSGYSKLHGFPVYHIPVKVSKLQVAGYSDIGYTKSLRPLAAEILLGGSQTQAVRKSTIRLEAGDRKKLAAVKKKMLRLLELFQRIDNLTEGVTAFVPGKEGAIDVKFFDWISTHAFANQLAKFLSVKARTEPAKILATGSDLYYRIEFFVDLAAEMNPDSLRGYQASKLFDDGAGLSDAKPIPYETLGVFFPLQMHLKGGSDWEQFSTLMKEIKTIWGETKPEFDALLDRIQLLGRSEMREFHNNSLQIQSEAALDELVRMAKEDGAIFTYALSGAGKSFWFSQEAEREDGKILLFDAYTSGHLDAAGLIRQITSSLGLDKSKISDEKSFASALIEKLNGRVLVIDEASTVLSLFDNKKDLIGRLIFQHHIPIIFTQPAKFAYMPGMIRFLADPQSTGFEKAIKVIYLAPHTEAGHAKAFDAFLQRERNQLHRKNMDQNRLDIIFEDLRKKAGLFYELSGGYVSLTGALIGKIFGVTPGFLYDFWGKEDTDGYEHLYRVIFDPIIDWNQFKIWANEAQNHVVRIPNIADAFEAAFRDIEPDNIFYQVLIQFQTPQTLTEIQAWDEPAQEAVQNFIDLGILSIRDGRVEVNARLILDSGWQSFKQSIERNRSEARVNLGELFDEADADEFGSELLVDWSALGENVIKTQPLNLRSVRSNSATGIFNGFQIFQYPKAMQRKKLEEPGRSELFATIPPREKPPQWMINPANPGRMKEVSILGSDWAILADSFPSIQTEMLLVPEYSVPIGLDDANEVEKLLIFHRKTAIDGYVNSWGVADLSQLHDHLYVQSTPLKSEIENWQVDNLKELDGNVRAAAFTKWFATATYFEGDDDRSLAQWVSKHAAQLRDKGIPYHAFFYPGKVIFILRNNSAHELWDVEANQLGGHIVHSLFHAGMAFLPEAQSVYLRRLDRSQVQTRIFNKIYQPKSVAEDLITELATHRSEMRDQPSIAQASGSESWPAYLLTPAEHLKIKQQLISQGFEPARFAERLKQMLNRLGRNEKFVIGRGMGYADLRTHWGQGKLRQESFGGNWHEATDLVYLQDTNANRRNILIGTSVPAFFGEGVAYWTFDDNMRQTAAFLHPAEIRFGGKTYVPMTFYMHLDLDQQIKVGRKIQAGSMVGKIAESRNPKSPVAAHVHFAVGLVEKSILKALPAGKRNGDFFKALQPFEKTGDIRWFDFRELLSKADRAAMFIEGDAAEPGFKHLVVVHPDEDIAKDTLVRLGRRFPGINVYRFLTPEKFIAWYAKNIHGPVALFSTAAIIGLAANIHRFPLNLESKKKTGRPAIEKNVIKTVRQTGRSLRLARSEMRRNLSPQEVYDLFFEIREVKRLELTQVEEELRRTKIIAEAISKLPIQRVLVVGAGIRWLPEFLYLMGKDVVFVDADSALTRAVPFGWKAFNSTLQAKGIAPLNYPVIHSEIGALDLKQHHLNPHSFDLVTMIDLSTDPQGDPRQWLAKSSELLREGRAYLLADMRPYMEEKTILHHMDKFFPNRNSLYNGRRFRGNYDRRYSQNIFWEVQNNRSEARFPQGQPVHLPVVDRFYARSEIRLSVVDKIGAELISLHKELANKTAMPERQEILRKIYGFYRYKNLALRTTVIKMLGQVPAEATEAGLQVMDDADENILAATVVTLGYLSQKINALDRHEIQHRIFEKLRLKAATVPALRREIYKSLHYLNDEAVREFMLEEYERIQFDVHTEALHALEQEMAWTQDERFINPVLQNYLRKVPERPTTLHGDLNMPRALAYLVSAGWVANHLRHPEVLRVALRFGYIDEFLYQKLLSGQDREAAKNVEQILWTTGIASADLYAAYLEAQEEADKTNLLARWHGRIQQFMTGLQSDETTDHKELIFIPTGKNTEAQVAQMLLFAALRRMDAGNLNAKLAMQPFQVKGSKQSDGAFFYLRIAGFLQRIEKIRDEIKKLFDAQDVPENLREIEGFAIVDYLAGQSETRDEESGEARFFLNAKWGALGRILEARNGELHVKTEYAKALAEDYADLAELENMNQVARISKLAHSKYSKIWKWAVLDIHAATAAEAFLKRISFFSKSTRLSRGARSVLRLYAYLLFTDISKSAETREQEWTEMFARIQTAEKIGSELLVPFGVEIQSRGVPANKMAAMKQALEYFDIPSPRRPEFYGTVETAFRPVFSADVIVLAIGFLEQLGFFEKLSEQGEVAALHQSFEGDLEDEAKWVALPLSLFMKKKVHRADTEFFEFFKTGMSKGMVHLNSKNQHVRAGRPLTSDVHTEFRTARLEHDGSVLNPMYRDFIPAAQMLGTAAANYIKSKKDEGSLSVKETKLAALWQEYRVALKAITDDEHFQTKKLMELDWYESTGDANDAALVGELEIIKEKLKVIRLFEAQPELAREFSEKVRKLFLEYGAKARDIVSRSEIRRLSADEIKVGAADLSGMLFQIIKSGTLEKKYIKYILQLLDPNEQDVQSTVQHEAVFGGGYREWEPPAESEVIALLKTVSLLKLNQGTAAEARLFANQLLRIATNEKKPHYIRVGAGAALGEYYEKQVRSGEVPDQKQLIEILKNPRSVYTLREAVQRALKVYQAVSWEKGAVLDLAGLANVPTDAKMTLNNSKSVRVNNDGWPYAGELLLYGYLAEAKRGKAVPLKTLYSLGKRVLRSMRLEDAKIYKEILDFQIQNGFSFRVLAVASLLRRKKRKNDSSYQEEFRVFLNGAYANVLRQLAEKAPFPTFRNYLAGHIRALVENPGLWDGSENDYVKTLAMSEWLALESANGLRRETVDQVAAWVSAMTFYGNRSNLVERQIHVPDPRDLVAKLYSERIQAGDTDILEALNVVISAGPGEKNWKQKSEYQRAWDMRERIQKQSSSQAVSAHVHTVEIAAAFVKNAERQAIPTTEEIYSALDLLAELNIHSARDDLILKELETLFSLWRNLGTRVTYVQVKNYLASQTTKGRGRWGAAGPHLAKLAILVSKIMNLVEYAQLTNNLKKIAEDHHSQSFSEERFSEKLQIERLRGYVQEAEPFFKAAGIERKKNAHEDFFRLLEVKDNLSAGSLLTAYEEFKKHVVDLQQGASDDPMNRFNAEQMFEGYHGLILMHFEIFGAKTIALLSAVMGASPAALRKYFQNISEFSEAKARIVAGYYLATIPFNSPESNEVRQYVTAYPEERAHELQTIFNNQTHFDSVEILKRLKIGLFGIDLFEKLDEPKRKQVLAILNEMQSYAGRPDLSGYKRLRFAVQSNDLTWTRTDPKIFALYAMYPTGWHPHDLNQLSAQDLLVYRTLLVHLYMQGQNSDRLYHFLPQMRDWKLENSASPALVSPQLLAALTQHQAAAGQKYGLWPAGIGMMQITYIGYLPTVQTPVFSGKLQELKIKADDTGEFIKEGEFISGSIQNQSKNMPQSFGNLWVVKSLERAKIFKTNGHIWKKIALSKDGGRIYYLHAETGIVVSICVNVRQVEQDRKLYAAEVKKDLQKRKAEEALGDLKLRKKILDAVALYRSKLPAEAETDFPETQSEYGLGFKINPDGYDLLRQWFKDWTGSADWSESDIRWYVYASGIQEILDGWARLPVVRAILHLLQDEGAAIGHSESEFSHAYALKQIDAVIRAEAALREIHLAESPGTVEEWAQKAYAELNKLHASERQFLNILAGQLSPGEQMQQLITAYQFRSEIRGLDSITSPGFVRSESRKKPSKGEAKDIRSLSIAQLKHAIRMMTWGGLIFVFDEALCLLRRQTIGRENYWTWLDWLPDLFVPLSCSLIGYSGGAIFALFKGWVADLRAILLLTNIGVPVAFAIEELVTKWVPVPEWGLGTAYDPKDFIGYGLAAIAANLINRPPRWNEIKALFKEQRTRSEMRLAPPDPGSVPLDPGSSSVSRALFSTQLSHAIKMLGFGGAFLMWDQMLLVLRSQTIGKENYWTWLDWLPDLLFPLSCSLFGYGVTAIIFVYKGWLADLRTALLLSNVGVPLVFALEELMTKYVQLPSAFIWTTYDPKDFIGYGLAAIAANLINRPPRWNEIKSLSKKQNDRSEMRLAPPDPGSVSLDPRSGVVSRSEMRDVDWAYIERVKKTFPEQAANIRKFEKIFLKKDRTALLSAITSNLTSGIAMSPAFQISQQALSFADAILEFSIPSKVVSLEDYYEDKWAWTLMQSFAGGKKAIQFLFDELKPLKDEVWKNAKRNNHWSVAYIEILLEAIYLGQMFSPADRKARDNALAWAAQNLSLEPQRKLAKWYLENPYQRQGRKSVAEHRLLFLHRDTRAQKSNADYSSSAQIEKISFLTKRSRYGFLSDSPVYNIEADTDFKMGDRIIIGTVDALIVLEVSEDTAGGPEMIPVKLLNTQGRPEGKLINVSRDHAIRWKYQKASDRRSESRITEGAVKDFFRELNLLLNTDEIVTGFGPSAYEFSYVIKPKVEVESYYRSSGLPTEQQRILIDRYGRRGIQVGNQSDEMTNYKTEFWIDLDNSNLSFKAIIDLIEGTMDADSGHSNRRDIAAVQSLASGVDAAPDHFEFNQFQPWIEFRKKWDARSEMRRAGSSVRELTIVQVMDWEILRKGGMMTYVHRLNEELTRRYPVRIHIVYRAEKANTVGGELKHGQGTLIFHPISDFESYPNTPLGDFRWMKKIRAVVSEIARSEPVDVIHSHQMNSPFDFALFGIKRIPVVTTNHMPYRLYAGKARWFWPLKWVIRLIFNLAAPWLVPVLVGYTTVALPRLRDSRTRLIKASIDTDFEDPAKVDRAKAREKMLGDKKDRFMIFYPARFSKQKNQPELIEVARILREKRPDFKFQFVLMGPQDENREINLAVAVGIRRENLEDCFQILPAGSPTVVREGYRASDLVVFPTRYESLGLMAIEAGAMEVPVVSYEAEGVDQALSPDAGVFVKQGDREAMAEAILDLADHPEKRRAMGKAGRAFAVQSFSQQANAEKHFALYREMARSEMRNELIVGGDDVGNKQALLKLAERFIHEKIQREENKFLVKWLRFKMPKLEVKDALAEEFSEFLSKQPFAFAYWQPVFEKIKAENANEPARRIVSPQRFVESIPMLAEDLFLHTADYLDRSQTRRIFMQNLIGAFAALTANPAMTAFQIAAKGLLADGQLLQACLMPLWEVVFSAHRSNNHAFQFKGGRAVWFEFLAADIYQHEFELLNSWLKKNYFSIRNTAQWLRSHVPLWKEDEFGRGVFFALNKVGQPTLFATPYMNRGFFPVDSFEPLLQDTLPRLKRIADWLRSLSDETVEYLDLVRHLALRGPFHINFTNQRQEALKAAVRKHMTESEKSTQARQAAPKEGSLSELQWQRDYYQNRMIENLHGRADYEDYKADLEAQRQVEEKIRAFRQQMEALSAEEKKEESLFQGLMDALQQFDLLRQAEPADLILPPSEVRPEKSVRQEGFTSQGLAAPRSEMRQDVLILKGGKMGVESSEAVEGVALTDKHGNILSGRKAKKDEAHKKGFYHMSAHIYFVDSKGRLLFQKRSQNKASSKGKWQVSVNGHVDFGELPIAAAGREAEEEVGIRIDSDRFIPLTKQNGIYREYDLEDGVNREFTTAYLYFVSDAELKKIKENYNLNEIEEFHLVSVNFFETDIWKHPGEYSHTLHYLASPDGKVLFGKIKRAIAKRVRSEARDGEGPRGEPPDRFGVVMTLRPDNSRDEELHNQVASRGLFRPGKRVKVSGIYQFGIIPGVRTQAARFEVSFTAELERDQRKDLSHTGKILKLVRIKINSVDQEAVEIKLKSGVKGNLKMQLKENLASDGARKGFLVHVIPSGDSLQTGFIEPLEIKTAPAVTVPRSESQEVLRNSEDQSFSLVLARLKAASRDTTFTTKSFFAWDAKEKRKTEFNFSKYLDSLVARDQWIYGSDDEKTLADRFHGMKNTELLNDQEVQTLLKTMQDLRGISLEEVLNRMSEDGAMGLVHHVVNPFSRELSLTLMRQVKNPGQQREFSRQSMVNRILIRELIYRWNLPDNAVAADKVLRSEMRTKELIVSPQSQIEVTRMARNIFSVSFVNTMTRSEFSRFYGQYFGAPVLPTVMDKIMKSPADLVVLSPALVHQKGFLQDKRVLGDKLFAIYAENEQQRLEFKNLIEAKGFKGQGLVFVSPQDLAAQTHGKYARRSALMSQDDSSETVTLLRQMGDYRILTDQGIAKLFHSVGLDALAAQIFGVQLTLSAA